VTGPPERTGDSGGRVSVYREFAPSSAAEGVVACTWAGLGGWDRQLRLLPDGCVDLVWDGRRLLVAGAGTAPGRYTLAGEARNTGLRLRPGAAGAVLGWPLWRLPGLLTLDSLWGAAARRAETELARTAGSESRRRLLEQLVVRRLDSGHEPDRLVLEAAQQLEHEAIGVDRVAAIVGLSARELRRRFHEHVGYGPKGLQRVLRFRRLLTRLGDMACGQVTVAAVAAELGYADQAHLTRECRRLSGSPPRSLVRCWAAFGRPGRNVQDVRAAWATDSPS
jgi:AraC-like DNA-binding protein